MKSYSLGFMFDTLGLNVALIVKNRPDWQRGKLNGIGGKLTDGESYDDAMRREFREETGADVADWDQFCTINGPGVTVEVYRSFGDLSVVGTKTDEKVVVMSVANLLLLDPNVVPMVGNLKWLVALALDRHEKTVVVTYR